MIHFANYLRYHQSVTDKSMTLFEGIHGPWPQLHSLFFIEQIRLLKIRNHKPNKKSFKIKAINFGYLAMRRIIYIEYLLSGEVL